MEKFVAPFVMYMDVKDSFYAGARKVEIHQFLEFAGMISVWIDMVATSSEQLSSDQFKYNWGTIAHVKEHQIEYLAEKFDCIFGELFRDEKMRSIFIKAMGWEKTDDT